MVVVCDGNKYNVDETKSKKEITMFRTFTYTWAHARTLNQHKHTHTESYFIVKSFVFYPCSTFAIHQFSKWPAFGCSFLLLFFFLKFPSVFIFRQISRCRDLNYSCCTYETRISYSLGNVVPFFCFCFNILLSFIHLINDWKTNARSLGCELRYLRGVYIVVTRPTEN